jgi:pimeloyl-ACP methyl ester carboxylesterase
LRRELQIDKDGSRSPVVRTSLGIEPDWRAPVALLLHGYNVEPHEAATAFERLLITINKASPPLPSLLALQSWVVFWQGYTSGGLARGKTLSSPAHYAAQIPSAVEAAQALEEYLYSRAGGGARVTLIAHSLGCRVALELLDRFARSSRRPKPEFPLVILMAAAVPTYFFEDLELLWKGALLPERVVVLFSGRDQILKYFFRAGQTLAGEGIFPKAVGASAEPIGFWSSTVVTDNGHSDYFGDSVTGAAIARSLGAPAPMNLPTVDFRTRIAGDAAMILPSTRLPSR